MRLTDHLTSHFALLKMRGATWTTDADANWKLKLKGSTPTSAYRKMAAQMLLRLWCFCFTAWGLTAWVWLRNSTLNRRTAASFYIACTKLLPSCGQQRRHRCVKC